MLLERCKVRTATHTRRDGDIQHPLPWLISYMRTLPRYRLAQTAAIIFCACIEGDDEVRNKAVLDLMPVYHVKEVHQPLAERISIDSPVSTRSPLLIIQPSNRLYLCFHQQGDSVSGVGRAQPCTKTLAACAAVLLPMGFDDPQRLIIYVEGHTQNKPAVISWMLERGCQVPRVSFE